MIKIVSVLAILALAIPCFAKYSGGSGTPENPYQIADHNDLYALADDTNDYNQCFIMTADIDLDPNLPGRKVFTKAVIASDPIDNNGNFDGVAFSGIFDGNNHRILNFTIDTGGASKNYLGLFGKTDSSCVLANVGVEHANITAGGESNYLGIVIGSNGSMNYAGGDMIGCYATGSIAAGDDSANIGGLIGFSRDGSLTNCHTVISINASDYSRIIGGLAGRNNGGSINNCYSTCFISGGFSSALLGGLVGGHFIGDINNCYATGSVTGEDYLGGLVGRNYESSIVNSYSTCSVTGNLWPVYVGGLVGDDYYGSIINSHSDGSVTGYDSGSFGGLVGKSEHGHITCCYARGSVIVGNGSYSVGGLVGVGNTCVISNCYATGSVTAGDSSYNLGGLVGGSSSTSIGNCYAAGSVTAGSSSWNLGGLVGTSGFAIDCYFLEPNDGGGPDNGCGEPLTEEEMKQQASFTGWNFNDVWDICESQNYPRLQWSILPADLECPYGVNFLDYSVVSDWWLGTCDQFNDYCSGTDFDLSGIIDEDDFRIFAQQWLKGF